MQYNNEYPMGNAHLKPMPNAQVYAYSGASYTTQDPYKPVASDPYQSDAFTIQQATDDRLKYRIRILKLISRVVALILSVTTLAPLAMTLAKFFSTKDTLFVVDGQQRTAWAHDSITWYTYMYFGVSLVSFVFNLVIVAAYWRGIKKANNVASVASWWSTTVLVGHVLVWIVSATLYRYGKEPVNEKFRDLWGWCVYSTTLGTELDLTPQQDL
jgi:ABC-type glycerol-3-phosphate transport system permease component